MAEFKQLIKERTKRLETIPDEFLSKVQRQEKRFFTEILSALDKLKRNADGKIIFSADDLSNINIISAIQDDLKSALLGSDYTKAVDAFAQQFDQQAVLSQEYFDKVFPDVSKSFATADATLAISKRRAVESLLGEPLDNELLKPITNLLEDAVTSNASWAETVANIRDYVEGTPEADGRLLRYAKQIAHDEFSIADRSYTNAVAEEIDAVWYSWNGNELPTSRCFCEERKGNYFHYKEIEQWGDGVNVGDCETGGGEWAGRREGTNAQTIFQYAGGYGCIDSVNPVSIFDIPMEVIQRNISNGNFEPSEKEIEMLGL